MNILFVAEHYKPIIQGGGEINHFLVCEALAKRGHQVVVLTSRSASLQAVETVDGVIVYRRLKTGAVDTFSGNVTRLFSLRKSIVQETLRLTREYHFDIIHLIGSTLEAAPELKKASIPIVATVESFVPLCPKGDFMCGNTPLVKPWSFGTFVVCLFRSQEIGKLRNRWYLAYNPLFWWMTYARFVRMKKALHSVHILAVSRFVQNLLNEFYGLASDVVPNFVDETFFGAQHKKKSLPLILYLGSLTQYKGAHVLLDAVKGMDCRVEIYGRGPLKEHLVQIIQKYNLNAQIFDPIDYGKLVELYQRADVVVFPSLWPEPFGRIPMEAGALGVPVIASNIGAIPEIVPDKKLLFRAGDPADLRRALEYALKKKPKFKKFIEQNYSEQRVIVRLLSVYGRVRGLP
jgi:glycosyltransferase involved in cell wall biosynthesis